jgi:hypothetical protein
MPHAAPPLQAVQILPPPQGRPPVPPAAPVQATLFDAPASALSPAAARAAGAGDPARSARQRWWQLQGRARRAGSAVEPVLVTPHFLSRLDTPACPVTRQPLASRDAQVVALRGDADVAAGHLALLGPSAAAALATRPGWTAAWSTAERLAGADGAGRASELGLDAAAWRRLAVLQAFVQPLAPAQAAWLPLLVLPPRRLRVLGAAQGLQVALTLALTAPGAARRLVGLAELAPDEGTRQALRVFVLTLLARCPRDLADRPPAARQRALEELWTDPLLQRRWLRLAGRLDDAAAAQLLRQGRRRGALPGPWRPLDDDAAVDGWGLPPRPAVACAGHEGPPAAGRHG